MLGWPLHDGPPGDLESRRRDGLGLEHSKSIFDVAAEAICDQQDVGSAGFDMDVKKPVTIQRPTRLRSAEGSAKLRRVGA